MRVDGRGLIDRRRPVRFRFDGRDITGFSGDTVASALVAAGERLVGRSFKYHRPRGLLTAGPEEPNALLEVLEPGGQITPNTRATVQEVFDGLQLRSQNRWPSLRHDLMAINDRFAPFLGAGFYYKTFMWPRRFWEGLYEPLIRRAAGLGRLSGQHDDGPYERAFAHADLLVIGAGPTGLMAALAAGRAGADVILAEADSRPGGRLLAEDDPVDGQPGHAWAEAVMAELRALPNVRVMLRTTITGAYDGGQWGALERVGLHRPATPNLPRECFWRITAPRAILAAGALERPIAFPDNDRPGVMLASAVRGYLHRFGAVAGRKVAIFGAHDDAHRTARDLVAAGVTVTAVIDPRDDAPGGDGYRTHAGAVVTGTRGRLGLTGVRVRQGTAAFWVEADVLAVAGGWNPSVHLTCHMGARPVWDADAVAFLPPAPDAPGAVPGLIPAGAAAGRVSTADCMADGLRAARAAVDAPDQPRPEASGTAPAQIPFWQVDAPGRAWLDLANDVTTKDVRQAAQEGFASVEHMKRYTTQGMAPDQGRSSNVAALAVLADATGRGIPDTGTTTFRPPFQPVPIGAMGAGARGAGFMPQRFTPADAAMRARFAPMVETGLWYRPSHFPAPGEDGWQPACVREVGYVRGAVGVADVSTLGKIELQGPDTGAFLDFVYANRVSTLKPGRVRYGLMLREDGHAMDDGTVARLGPDRWLVTTTTAAADTVMRHLDFVQQAYRPRLRTRFLPVTDAWAQYAIAGPRARRLLDGILDAPLGELAGGFPFMACGAVRVMGVPARLFRISFSGEEGYEIAVPARFGAALFRDLVARADSLGGGPYGMEALNVLRIEKGFLTHAEMHGRTTAFDLGLERMISTHKDCIGKAASRRPGLRGPDRAQLVGLRPVVRTQRITAGAHLFDAGAPLTRPHARGHVTSVGPSPAFGWLGLGFLQDGRARHGDRVRLVDRLRDIDVMCDVRDPVVFDPDGGRMRG